MKLIQTQWNIDDATSQLSDWVTWRYNKAHAPMDIHTVKGFEQVKKWLMALAVQENIGIIYLGVGLSLWEASAVMEVGSFDCIL